MSYKLCTLVGTDDEGLLLSLTCADTDRFTSRVLGLHGGSWDLASTVASSLAGVTIMSYERHHPSYKVP